MQKAFRPEGQARRYFTGRRIMQMEIKDIASERRI